MEGPSPRKTRSRRRVPEHQLEEALAGHGVRSVRPLTEDDLPSAPPPKEDYRQGMLQGLRELWRFREVIHVLGWRDIRVRYKQAALGAAWALLNPLVLMVLFSVVFGTIARIETPGNVPYPVFSYVALVPWALFSGALTYGATSVITNASIIRKVYCPREAFPIAGTIGAGFDFLMSSVVLLGMLLAFGFFPRVTWIAALGLLLIMYVLAVSLTMLVSVITAFYRDTRYGVPLIIQVLLFASPVGYPLERATENLSPVLATLYVYGNPLTPLIHGLRQAILFGEWPALGPTMTALGITVALALFSYWVFKQLDVRISDIT